MARQWQQLSLEDSKRHPLYGIKNWLAIFAFGILIAPLRTIGEFSNAAHESGLTLLQLLSADISTGAFIKASLAFNVTIAILLLWLLFSKHRHFRVASITLLVLYWPAYLVVAFTTGGTQIPGLVSALTLQFLSSFLLISIWVAYLQRSRRVRVTFENCVVVEKIKTSAIHNNRMPLDTTQTTTAGNDAYAAALAEIEEHRLDKGTWARSFAESGGDESKAKALYIKARAESIVGSEVWEDTRPPSAEDAGTKVTDEGRTTSISYVPVTKSLTTSKLEIGVLVIFVLAFFAWWQYMEYTKRQAATENSVHSPVSDLIQYGANDRPAPPAQTSTERPPWSGNPFDQFDTVDEIAMRARQFPQLNEPRAWAAVLAWQESNMQVHKNPANEALYFAVGTVLAGLKANSGVCRPGRVEIVSAAQESNSMPAGTPFTLNDCDR